MIIKMLKARQILDSRGIPTIEAELLTEKGFFSSQVPSGASKGSFEALELRDNAKAFKGNSVFKAVKNVNKVIAKKIKGKDFSTQKELDEFLVTLDGTKNKSRLGANAILSVSIASARAFSCHENMLLHEFLGSLIKCKKFSLPVPQLNLINGGKHASLENDIQEHLIAPIKAKNFSEALRASAECYYSLKELIKKKFNASACLIADEGGFVPPLNNAADRLELILKAIEEAGYSKEMRLALDSAASEFFNAGYYNLYNKKMNVEEMIDYYSDLIKTFPIYSIEDPLAENDFFGWQQLTKSIGKKIQIIGDDLLVTNTERIKKAIKLKACNALLLKVNQIGTVTEALNAAMLAFKSKWNVIVSHRSGETCDSFIADLVVGINAMQCKFGAPARSERLAKYNQLLRLEEILGKKSYAGKILSKKFK